MWFIDVKVLISLMAEEKSNIESFFLRPKENGVKNFRIFDEKSKLHRFF